MRSRFIQKVINYMWHLPLSVYANIRYGRPSRGLVVIGVTGTDGKTTVCNMIYHILKQHYKVGLISTIGAKVDEDEIDIGLHVTTPAHISIGKYLGMVFSFKFKEFFDAVLNPESIHKYVRYLKDQGVEYVVIESTSQGLDQFRLYGINFTQAIYTNIKKDHLDYHKDVEGYMMSKSKLIDYSTEGGLVIINKDDSSSAFLKSKAMKKSRKVLEYSQDDASNLHFNKEGIHFDFKGGEFFVPIIGMYNLSNLLAAILSTSVYIDIKEIADSLKTFHTPRGRMQVMNKAPLVIVDFAHTPTSLKRALETIRSLREEEASKTKGRIITVFGCAGKRDKTRRKMGRISFKYSDITVLTAEDPRDEKLAEINEEIFEYAKEEGARNKIVIENSEIYSKFDIKSLNLQKGDFVLFNEESSLSRKNAIDFAINLANKNDIVFITGKGHEKSLAFGEKEYEWSDQEVVKEVLNNKKK